MRLAQAVLFALLPLCAACKSGGSSDGGGSTSSGGDTSSSGNDGYTGGGMFVCEAVGEFFFDDGVGLGAISVDAIRSEAEQLRYDVYVHGDDEDVTQVLIGFIGMPSIGTMYGASSTVAENKPIVTLFPDLEGAPTLVGGTVMYNEVGMVEGSIIDLEMELHLSNGTLRGCVTAALVASGGG